MNKIISNTMVEELFENSKKMLSNDPQSILDREWPI